MQSFVLARERDASKINQYAVSLGEALVKKLVDEGIVTARGEVVRPIRVVVVEAQIVTDHPRQQNRLRRRRRVH